ncbi:MAG: cation:proton antiporter [Chlorobi bacterium]|nr:cation:proton antiporter [Chlorobiota bacterium]
MVNTILYIALGFIIISILMTLTRFVTGKTSVDRVIAFDIMTISSIGIIVIISHFTIRLIYLDVAIVYGLLSFLGVVIVAKFIERGL